MSYLSRKFLVSIYENDRAVKTPFSLLIAKDLRCVYQPSIDTAGVEKTPESIAFSMKAKILVSRPYKVDVSRIKIGQLVVVKNHDGIQVGEYLVASTIPGNESFVVVLDRRAQ